MEKKTIGDRLVDRFLVLESYAVDFAVAIKKAKQGDAVTRAVQTHKAHAFADCMEKSTRCLESVLKECDDETAGVIRMIIAVYIVTVIESQDDDEQMRKIVIDTIRELVG